MGGSWKTPTDARLRDYLHLDDPIVGEWAGTNDGGIQYGLDLQTGPDQTAKLQAAVDHAGRDGVPNTILIAGTFACDGTITTPTDVQVNWLGTGTGDGIQNSPAGIQFRTDSGPDCEDPAAEAAIWTTKDHFFWMQGFTVSGPGWGGGALYGQFPANLSGLYVEGACVIRDMRFNGFGSGVLVQNDHHKFENVNAQSNGYALNFVNNPTGGLGDETFLKCQFSAVTRASIAICDTNTIANGRFGDNGHSGFGPYVIYRYSNKDGVTGSCTGSAASPDLTSVNITTRTPGVGSRVSGTNIPWGAKVIGVSGSSGNYTLTLNVNPTGVVAAVTVYQAPRGTVIVGVVHENWSFEGEGNAVFYDEPWYEYGAPGGWSNVVHDPPADVSSFGAQELRWAQLVACTGSNGASQITAVDLSDWRPLIGDSVENAWTFPETATPFQLDTDITSVVGGPGNWTIGISKPLVAAATQVRIGKAIRNVAYDVYQASMFHWRAGPIPFLANFGGGRRQPHLIRATVINNITADDIALGNFIDYPGTRAFGVYNGSSGLNQSVPNEHANILDGVVLAVGARSGRIMCSARLCWEDVSRGQVLEIHSYATCGRWRGTNQSMYCGVALHDCLAAEVVLVLIQGANNFTQALNTSGVTIAQGTLIKPHASGGVMAATDADDGLIIGRVHDGSIANGALGAVRLQVT